MIPIVFALLLFLLADGVVHVALRWIAPGAAESWAGWQPGVRGHLVGGLVALALLIACIWPHWREAGKTGGGA